MTEITGPVLHRALVECRDEVGDILDDVGVKLYKHEEWRDAEQQYDTLEDLLIEVVDEY